MASAWWRFAMSKASLVWTMMRSSTPSRAMRVPGSALKTMLFCESSWVIGSLARFSSPYFSSYLAMETHEPTSSQSKVASMLSTRSAFSMSA